MASIRDLVAALRQRDGVDAAIVLGRDGLLIDSQVVVPSWSTSKSWDTGHPAADHVISGGGSVTFTLHGPGTVGSDRLDTGIAEPITGGTVRKLT